MREEHKTTETGQSNDFIKSKSTYWFYKRLAKRITNEITKHIRPRKEIYQNTSSIPTKSRDNSSSRTNIIKIDPKITDNRTSEKAIRIFESYQRHKKRNNKEYNLLRPLIKKKQKYKR